MRYNGSMLMLKKSHIVLTFIFSALSATLLASTTYAADYAFPVIGQSSFSNDFDAPRSNGPHHATDIIANKHQQIVSRTDGVITFVGCPQPSWGYAVIVRASNGNEYWYLHMNNDRKGTDDGGGGCIGAFGPDIERGNYVKAGQLLGYVGDSGNSEDTVSHLHLEVVRPDDSRVNPYHGLVNNSYYLSRPALDYPEVGDEILPSTPNFTGGYTMAFGNMDNDPAQEIVIGPGQGGKYVKIIEKDGTHIRSFQPNGNAFKGGVDVATGDVDGDGVEEIVTGAGPGGKYVKIFERDGTPQGGFAPNGTNFLGGVDVATGDLDGDGTDEIITGARRGGKYVKVFNLDGTHRMTINPYDSRIGVSVTTGNIDDDPEEEIITGARRGGGPRVNLYDSNGHKLSSYYTYNSTFKGGIRVDAGEVVAASPYDEVVTISESGGTPRAKVAQPTGGFLGWTDYAAADWWRGYHNIAVSDDADLYMSMGIDRRSTIRPLDF